MSNIIVMHSQFDVNTDIFLTKAIFAACEIKKIFLLQ